MAITAERKRLDAYTEGVRPKTNYVWTTKILKRMYHLRIVEKKSSVEVALILGCTKTHVHNQMRRMYRRIRKECLKCGKPLSPKDCRRLRGRVVSILCPKCSRHASVEKIQNRETALERGKCGYCQTRPVTPGRTSCDFCRSATHRRRNAEGLCSVCGEHPIRKNGLALCRTCADMMSSKKSAIKASVKDYKNEIRKERLHATTKVETPSKG